MLPSSDRHYLCCGPGFHYNQWNFDFSYTYLIVEKNTVNNSSSTGYVNPSTIEGNAHLIGMSVGYKF